MDLKPIKTETDYRAALKRLEEIFDAEPGTHESDELEILGLILPPLVSTIIKSKK